MGLYVFCVVAMLGVGRHVHLPDEQWGMSSYGGSLTVSLEQMMGRRLTTDFLVDYASARALADGVDPYAISGGLIDRIGGPEWPVPTANPHPPTMVLLTLPFALVRYEWALAAWSIAMVFALVLTVRLSGARWEVAIPAGLALAVCWPGAYGIGNAVPVIGLGIAMAVRYRDTPWLAAAGAALAAAPKTSGLLILVPFVLTFRWRTVVYTLGWMAALAAAPLAWFPRVWNTYADRGLDAIRQNAARVDNGAILNLGAKLGVPHIVTGLALVGIALLIARRSRDVFWPIVWLVVAALPISWMYSMLTFIPLVVHAVRRGGRVAWVCSILAAALAASSTPLGSWPTWVQPVVVLLMAPVAAQAGGGEWWPEWHRWRTLIRPRECTAASTAQG